MKNQVPLAIKRDLIYIRPMKTPIGREALIEAIEIAGGQVKLAGVCQIKLQNIGQWLDATRAYAVPAHHVLAIESATGISKHRLRPDVFGEASPP